MCPRGSVFTRGPMERGDSAAQVDRVGCATAAREGRCGRRTDGSRFCSASSSTTGRVVSPLMPLTTPGTQHHSTPSSLRTISRKNPARAGAPPRARGARKPDPWARAHYAGSANHKGFSHRGWGRGVPRNRRSVAHYRQGGTARAEVAVDVYPNRPVIISAGGLWSVGEIPDLLGHCRRILRY